MRSVELVSCSCCAGQLVILQLSSGVFKISQDAGLLSKSSKTPKALSKSQKTHQPLIEVAFWDLSWGEVSM